MSERPDKRAIHPRILIVEDDADQRELMCDAISLQYDDPSGEGIVGVASAAECLEQDFERFDVVLLDYHLPDAAGLDLLGDILDRRDIPVIFVTGENDSATAAEAIRCGAEDYVVKLGDYLFAIPALVNKAISQHRIKNDNRRLQEELEEMLLALKEKNAQLEESLQKLQRMAATDHLTGLANRRDFADSLERCYSQAVRYEHDLTCCMCDLDYYKELNDMLGHQVGDEILIIAAEVVCSELRTSDIAARYGGDEMVLLLPHTSVERATAVCERIRKSLFRRTESHVKLPRGVTMSIGVASLKSNHPSSADALVAMGDRALYRAKELGKDRIVAFGQQEKPAVVSV